MPKFLVRFERDWIDRDYFEREIEASSQEEAETLADEMAAEADMDCPDDATSTNASEAGSWSAVNVDRMVKTK